MVCPGSEQASKFRRPRSRTIEIGLKSVQVHRIRRSVMRRVQGKLLLTVVCNDKAVQHCCSLAAGLPVLLSSGKACFFRWSSRLLVVEPLYWKSFKHNLQRATVLPCAFTSLVKCTQHFAREVRSGNAGLFAAGSMSNLHEQDKDAP